MDADGSDSMAVAQLVVATSYFYVVEAERIMIGIATRMDAKEVDATALTRKK